MDKKEGCGRKVCYFVLFAVSAVTFLGIGGAQIERADNAQKLDDLYNEKFE